MKLLRIIGLFLGIVLVVCHLLNLAGATDLDDAVGTIIIWTYIFTDKN